MESAMEEIVGGKSNDADIEHFLLLLRQKGETASEVTAAAKIMRRHAVKLSRAYPELLDTCGTGGDGKGTLNVSTLSSLVAAAAGAKVGKHGNRSVSSVCGSADLLEMLGVRIDLTPPVLEKCLQKTGFAFFFAPLFHPATRFAGPARKKIQGKTLFNLLGPLANPAGASNQLMGVYEERLVELMAGALMKLGSRRAMVVHGTDGLDEISLSAPTQVAEVVDGMTKLYRIGPETFGLTPVPIEALQCRSKEESRETALKVLKGSPGAASDVVAMNAGAALYVAGIARSLADGFVLARKTLQNGAAQEKLLQITSVTQEEGKAQS